MSGGWSKTLNISSPTDLEVTLRHRLVFKGGYDPMNGEGTFASVGNSTAMTPTIT